MAYEDIVKHQTLSEQQSEAVNLAYEWFNDHIGKRVLAIAGYAGTGKSFIIPHIINTLDLELDEVAVCAYTGKAAHNLRRRDIFASTIHALIYTPYEVVNSRTGKTEIHFKKNKELPRRVKMIVVDEASMVNKEVYNDLLAYGKKTLYIGDCFQLPPVNSDDFNLMQDGKTDYKLTQIHRVAENNKIVRLSMDIRNGIDIPFQKTEDFVRITSAEMTDADLLAYDQIICGKNTTKNVLNECVRSLKGYSGLPMCHEKLIVLRNNYACGVYNGQHILLTDDATKKGKLTLKMEYIYEYDTKDAVKMILSERMTNSFSILNFVPDAVVPDTKMERKSKILADYGYAITVHKCVAEDTYLYTENGMLEIKDLWKDNDKYVRLFDTQKDIATKDGITNTSQIYKGDIENGYGIKTKCGYEIIGSNRHPVYYFNNDFSWKFLPKIQVGDYMLINRNNNCFNDVYMKSGEYTLDESIGLLFGFLVGDGSYCDRKDDSIELSNEDFAVNTLFTDIIRTKFGYEPCFYTRKHGSSTYKNIRVFSKKIRALFKSFGLEYVSRENKCVPLGILISPKTVQSKFLQGLFDTDGSVSKTKIRFVNKSEKLIKQIQLMLLNFGIISGISSHINKKHGIKYYTLTVSRKYDVDLYKLHIGFNVHHKKHKLHNIISKYKYDSVPCLAPILKTIKQKIQEHIGVKYRIKNDGWYRNDYYVLARKINDVITGNNFDFGYEWIDKLLNMIDKEYSFIKNLKEYEILIELKNKRYFFDKVDNVFRKEIQLYDLTVPNGHTYISNGFVSHNSQGSEWNNVILYDDGFGGYGEQRQRWLYTGITRSTEKLMWVVH